MPIYEYRCTECNHKLEALQSLRDAPLVTCPACGKNALTKLVTAAGFQLKGSGWYQTDFRGGSGGEKKAETSDKPGKADTPKEGAAAADGPAKTESSAAKPASSDPAPSAPSAPSTPASST